MTVTYGRHSPASADSSLVLFAPTEVRGRTACGSRRPRRPSADRDLDACLPWYDGKAYFFRGDRYLAYDMLASAVIGNPHIDPAWPGLAPPVSVPACGRRSAHPDTEAVTTHRLTRHRHVKMPATL